MTPLLTKITFRNFPLIQLAALVSSETHAPLLPSASRVSTFESATGLSFEPSLYASVDPIVHITCPKCQTINSVEWHRDDGKGFAQADFELLCEKSKENCGLNITREVCHLFCLHFAPSITKLLLTFASQCA